MIAGSDGERNDIKGVGPAALAGLLAPPAHLIKPDRGNRSDQRKPGYQREDERQQVVAKGEPRQDEPSDGIDDAEKHDIGAEGREIVEPALQRFADARRPDLAHRGRRGKRAACPAVSTA